MKPTRPRKPYASDLSDIEWQIVEPFVQQPAGKGRKRTVDIREVLDAIFYINKTGCQWHMLPHDFPDYRHVHYYYRIWRRKGIWDAILRELRRDIRIAEGRDPEPSGAILDSQSVKTDQYGEERGYDGGKRVKGRKRHIVVDTLGLLLFVLVTSASVQDRDGGVELCDDVQQQAPRVRKMWADSAYSGELVEYVQRWCRFVLEIIKKPREQRGFQVHPIRWIVERSLGWLNWYRRLSKDYEKTVESSETMIKIANVRIMLRRLVADIYPMFNI
jgi:putative transposase